MAPTIKELWQVHVFKMNVKGEPSVALPTFYRRLNSLGWDVKRAVETPAYVTRRSHPRKKGFLHWFRKLWKKVWK